MVASARSSDTATAPFGTVFTDRMPVSRYRGGAWTPSELRATDALPLHPASHVLHYASTCFEGFKAFRRDDGSVHLFRLDRHMRSTPDFGSAKTGANYASALRHVEQARRDCAADQVVFCPDGDVQETGASNFLLVNDTEVLTKAPDGTHLHGVTRDSVLELARRLGYRVSERNVGVRELLEWVKSGEVALSGTAAVLTGVATLIHDASEHTVAGGAPGPNTQRLKSALEDVQYGRAEDHLGWLKRVDLSDEQLRVKHAQ